MRGRSEREPDDYDELEPGDTEYYPGADCPLIMDPDDYDIPPDPPYCPDYRLPLDAFFAMKVLELGRKAEVQEVLDKYPVLEQSITDQDYLQDQYDKELDILDGTTRAEIARIRKQQKDNK